MFFVFFNMLAAIYCAPFIVAIIRRHHNIAPIVVINVLLGWTVLGWAAALALAVSQTKKETVPTLA
jgi:hypothetical protein